MGRFVSVSFEVGFILTEMGVVLLSYVSLICDLFLDLCACSQAGRGLISVAKHSPPQEIV